MSHMIPPEEDAKLIEAAQAFIAVMNAQCLKHYPTFGAWNEESRVAAAMILGVQQLVRPDAYGVLGLNLYHAMYGVGVAAGNQTAAIDEAKVPEFIQRFTNGFHLGRRNRNETVMAMPTAGGPKPN